MVQAAEVWVEGSKRAFRFMLAAQGGIRAQNISGHIGI
jgi:hypothetical protein